MTPFYALALKLFTRTQNAQIQKGLAKYPEAFNPRNWTPQELLTHALEETVDLTHYLVGLKVLLDDRDEEIRNLKHEIELLKGEQTQPTKPKDGLRSWSFPDTPENREKVAKFLGKKPSYMDLDDE